MSVSQSPPPNEVARNMGFKSGVKDAIEAFPHDRFCSHDVADKVGCTVETAQRHIVDIRNEPEGPTIEEGKKINRVRFYVKT